MSGIRMGIGAALCWLAQQLVEAAIRIEGVPPELLAKSESFHNGDHDAADDFLFILGGEGE
jgi:hypothetical protein